MFYGRNNKIGYTNDLGSMMLEVKRDSPNNKLVYFREFMDESSARKFESWLKNLSERAITKFIVSFQDKINKIERV